jgi:hypothetical protein
MFIYALKEKKKFIYPIWVIWHVLEDNLVYEFIFGLNSLYILCFMIFIFCPLNFTFYQIWYLWYMQRQKWYLRPIFSPKLMSSHVILQVSACMRDTCPRNSPQRWRSYHFLKFFIIIILMISYIYLNLGWPSHPQEPKWKKRKKKN